MALADRVAALVVRRGNVSVSIRRPAPTYNRSTGKTTGSVLSSDVKGVLRSFRHAQVDGVTIRREDQQLLVAATSALSLVPGPGDVVVIDSASWAVQNTRAIRRNLVVVAYDIHIRAA